MSGPGRHDPMPGPRPSGVVARLYRALLRLLPTRMRDEAGPAMEDTFERRLRDRRAGSTRLGVARFVVAESIDVVITSVRLRLPRRGRSISERGGDGTMRRTWTDLRVAVRTLLRRPAFLLVTSVTLALGIGANAAMFSVVHAVVLRPLAYPEPDRLVMVFQTFPDIGWERGPVSLHAFLSLEEEANSFASVGAASAAQQVLLDRGDPRRVFGRRVSGGFFRMLGVEAELGRTILPADDRPGAERVLVLSHALWTQAFGAARDVIGSTVRLDDGAYTLVGVMPGDFPGLGTEDYWTALALDPAEVERDMSFLNVLGRLAEGVDSGAAERQADALFARQAEYVPAARNRHAHVVSRHEVVVGDVRGQLLLLLGAVGLVLLVACTNVAGLFLTRGARRRRELALRAALGAGRSSLIRQMLVESAVVASFGGALGVVVAIGSVHAFRLWGPTDLPRGDTLAVDAPTILFLAVVTVACTALFGLLPALRAAATPPAAALKEGGAGAGVSTRPQALLAVGQIALATVLLVSAGLLGRSLAHMTAVDPGFSPEGVLTARLPLPETETDERVAFVGELDRRLAALPGVGAAGLAWSLPFTGGEASTRAMTEGSTLAPEERPQVWMSPVTPGFFRAMGMSMVGGMSFDGGLGPDDPPVAVINESLAETLWPGQAAVGRRYLQGGGDDPTLIEVVGVVADVRTTSLAENARPHVYTPFGQSSWATQAFLVLRTSGDPLDLVTPLRGAVAELDDELPLDPISTLSGVVDATLARPRFRAALVTGFAVLGALLALVGIYGVMALVVAGRRREIGVRIALGAERGAVRSEVVGQALRIAGAGLVMGLVAASAVSRSTESLLFGVRPFDPLTYGAVIATVVAGVALAVLPSARHAAAVDPLEVLQAE